MASSMKRMTERRWDCGPDTRMPQDRTVGNSSSRADFPPNRRQLSVLLSGQQSVTPTELTSALTNGIFGRIRSESRNGAISPLRQPFRFGNRPGTGNSCRPGCSPGRQPVQTGTPPHQLPRRQQHQPPHSQGMTSRPWGAFRRLPETAGGLSGRFSRERPAAVLPAKFVLQPRTGDLPAAG